MSVKGDSRCTVQRPVLVEARFQPTGTRIHDRVVYATHHEWTRLVTMVSVAALCRFCGEYLDS